MAVDIWESLVEEGIISREMLEKAKDMQDGGNNGTGFNLALLGADEEAIARHIAAHYGLEYIDLLSVEPETGALGIIPRAKAESLAVFPVSKEGNSVLFACADPYHPKISEYLKEIGFKSGIQAKLAVAPESFIKLAIEQSMPREEKSQMAETLKDMENDDVDLEVMKDAPQIEDAEAVDEAPVIRLSNSLIADAVEKGASDIHVEPFEKEMKVRYRIDGALLEQPKPPAKYKKALVARYKVMARLDIMEKRKPQDGRIKIKVKGRTIDLRVSALPVVWGEKIVMRILDQTNLNLDLTKLGFEKDELKKFNKAIHNPYGIILVTGPTGSGKTTTLYSALSTINKPDINIMTAEDPVEYNLESINQVQVMPEADMTFANALRAFLRQDPDVVMVGEIRDQETAEISIKAALTGHLVISTLHTNDAPTTISRMMDMGVEPFYIGSSVILVLAQRLVKKVCSECSSEASYDEEILKQVGFTDEMLAGAKFMKGEGCEVCNGTGYKGRVAIYELMVVDDEIKQVIMQGKDSDVIKKAALKNGMNTLRRSALLKMQKGLTTLEEVLRVTAGD